jgi:hypothetical protein
MNRDGFSLIECTAYCFIVGLLSMLVLNFFTTHYQRLAIMGHHAHQRMLLAAAHELLARDLYAAHADASKWESSNQSIVFCHDKQSVGWKLQDTNLYRIQGTYDFSAHAWSKKQTALVAADIQRFESVIQKYANRITQVKTHMALKDSHRQKTIVLARRILE